MNGTFLRNRKRMYSELSSLFKQTRLFDAQVPYQTQVPYPNEAADAPPWSALTQSIAMTRETMSVSKDSSKT